MKYNQLEHLPKIGYLPGVPRKSLKPFEIAEIVTIGMGGKNISLVPRTRQLIYVAGIDDIGDMETDEKGKFPGGYIPRIWYGEYINEMTGMLAFLGEPIGIVDTVGDIRIDLIDSYRTLERI